MKPEYDHDCPNCTFLAHNNDVDYYVCYQPKMDCLVYRNSSEPSDYGSFSIRPTKKHLLRALARKLDLSKRYPEHNDLGMLALQYYLTKQYPDIPFNTWEQTAISLEHARHNLEQVRLSLCKAYKAKQLNLPDNLLEQVFDLYEALEDYTLYGRS